MSILQFIASIIGSVSWPTAVVIIVLILRKPLSAIILSLSKVSYRDIGLECLPLSQRLKGNPLLLERLLEQNNGLNSEELTKQERKIVEGLLRGEKDTNLIITGGKRMPPKPH